MARDKRLPAGINPHEERELELLLSDEKKVAMFLNYHWESSPPDERYDKAVSEGKLIRDEMDYVIRNHLLHDIYFCLPGEEWRIERLKETALALTNEYTEEGIKLVRERGELLGYNDQEIEAYVEHFGPRKDNPEWLQPHTNIELELMEAGTKPLAIFSDFATTDRNTSSLIEWTAIDFEHLIKAGLAVKREFVEEEFFSDGTSHHAHHLYIALKGEEWRIDEAIELDKKLHHAPPNENYYIEKRLGELVGYTDEQISAFLDHVYGPESSNKPL